MRRLPSPSCNVDETKPFSLEKLIQHSKGAGESEEMDKETSGGKMRKSAAAMIAPEVALHIARVKRVSRVKIVYSSCLTVSILVQRNFIANLKPHLQNLPNFGTIIAETMFFVHHSALRKIIEERS